jgi:hypothetical protein
MFLVIQVYDVAYFVNRKQPACQMLTNIQIGKPGTCIQQWPLTEMAISFELLTVIKLSSQT